MTAFNIQELVEHVETTQQEIRGRWYPVRPLQLTGLVGLKLRIKGAIQVLLGKADTVEWSLRPVKQKKVSPSVPKLMEMSIVAGVLTPMPNGFDHTTLNVVKYKESDVIKPIFQSPVPHGIVQWKEAGVGEFWIGELQTGRGQRIEVRYDKRSNSLTYTGPKVIKVDFQVK